MGKRQYFNRFTEKEKRRELRTAEVPAEKKLWSRIRNRQVHGARFRRQVSIGSYVVDFYCPELKLVVEADGPSHFLTQEASDADSKRQWFIESLGARFLRFTNTQIHEETDAVIDAIAETVLRLRQQPPSPPSPRGD